MSIQILTAIFAIHSDSKSHMLVQKAVTLNDLEQHNGHDFE